MIDNGGKWFFKFEIMCKVYLNSKSIYNTIITMLQKHGQKNDKDH
jgi:hypothetical protein